MTDQEKANHFVLRLSGAAVFMFEVIQDSPGNFWRRGRAILAEPREWLAGAWWRMDLKQKFMVLKLAGVEPLLGDQFCDEWRYTDLETQEKIAAGLKHAVQGFFELQEKGRALDSQGLLDQVTGFNKVKLEGLRVAGVL